MSGPSSSHQPHLVLARKSRRDRYSWQSLPRLATCLVSRTPHFLLHSFAILPTCSIISIVAARASSRTLASGYDLGMNPWERHVGLDPPRSKSAHHGSRNRHSQCKFWRPISVLRCQSMIMIMLTSWLSTVSNMMNKLSGQPDSYDKKFASLYPLLVTLADHL